MAICKLLHKNWNAAINKSCLFFRNFYDTIEIVNQNVLYNGGGGKFNKNPKIINNNNNNDDLKSLEQTFKVNSNVLPKTLTNILTDRKND